MSCCDCCDNSDAPVLVNSLLEVFRMKKRSRITPLSRLRFLCSYLTGVIFSLLGVVWVGCAGDLLIRSRIDLEGALHLTCISCLLVPVRLFPPEVKPFHLHHHFTSDVMWGWRLRYKAVTKHWEPMHCAVRYKWPPGLWVGFGWFFLFVWGWFFFC